MEIIAVAIIPNTLISIAPNAKKYDKPIPGFNLNIFKEDGSVHYLCFSDETICFKYFIKLMFL